MSLKSDVWVSDQLSHRNSPLKSMSGNARTRGKMPLRTLRADFVQTRTPPLPFYWKFNLLECR